MFLVFLYNGTKKVHLSLTSSMWADKMSTASIGGSSGVTVTINKGDDDKAQPQRV